MDRDKGIGKYKTINRLLDIIGIALLIMLIVTTFIYWGKAPDMVPTHFNFKGEIDAYGSKNTLFIFQCKNYVKSILRKKQIIYISM